MSQIFVHFLVLVFFQLIQQCSVEKLGQLGNLQVLTSDIFSHNLPISPLQIFGFDNEDHNRQADSKFLKLLGARLLTSTGARSRNFCKYSVEILILRPEKHSKILCLTRDESNALESFEFESESLPEPAKNQSEPYDQIALYKAKPVIGFLQTRPYTSQVHGHIFKKKFFFGSIYLFPRTLDFLPIISSRVELELELEPKPKQNTSISFVDLPPILSGWQRQGQSRTNSKNSKSSKSTTRVNHNGKNIFKVDSEPQRQPTVDTGNWNLSHGHRVQPRIRRRAKRHLAKTFTGDALSPLKNFGLLCSLCILMDAEFIEHHGNGDWSQVLLKLERAVDYASWIFRATDWNEDGMPDNIGFRVEIINQNPWVPFSNVDNANYSTPILGKLVLMELSKLDFRNCCLGIGFTMRPFTDNQIGLTLIASPSPKVFGGICDNRHPDAKQKMKSANLVLISGAGLLLNSTLIKPNQSQSHGHQSRLQQQQRRPLGMPDVMRVLVHELGHAFGVSKHDNDVVELKLQCSGSGQDPNSSENDSDRRQVLFEPPKGRFIMWGRTLQGKRNFRANNLEFSKCSKQEVAKILKRGSSRRAATTCLEPDYDSFCGNGILEEREECDCGTEENCRRLDCCGSRSSPTPCEILPKFRLNSSECLKFQIERGSQSFANFASYLSENPIWIFSYVVLSLVQNVHSFF